jgi:hypothetical protein
MPRYTQRLNNPSAAAPPNPDTAWTHCSASAPSIRAMTSHGRTARVVATRGRGDRLDIADAMTK